MKPDAGPKAWPSFSAGGGPSLWLIQSLQEPLPLGRRGRPWTVQTVGEGNLGSGLFGRCRSISCLVLLWAPATGRRVLVKRLGRPPKALPAPIPPLRSLLLEKARFPFPWRPLFSRFLLAVAANVFSAIPTTESKPRADALGPLVFAKLAKPREPSS